MSNANKVLEIARNELGYDRFTDPQPGTKYGRWYADLVGDKYFGLSGVPYCAMFVTWVFDQAKAKCAGLPGAYTPTMLNAAKSQGRVRGNKRDAQPGDNVYFNWDGGVVDHVGIVEVNFGNYLQTIEGNTNNGKVARRTRSWNTVEGIVVPDWGIVTPSAPVQGETPKPNNNGYIDEDGWWGPDTTGKFQHAMGTSEDKIISGQDAGDMRAINKGGLQYNTWKIGKGGSDAIRAWQTFLKKKGLYNGNIDGYMGVKTWVATETYFGVVTDPYVSGPSTTVKKIQKALNNGNIFSL